MSLSNRMWEAVEDLGRELERDRKFVADQIEAPEKTWDRRGHEQQQHADWETKCRPDSVRTPRTHAVLPRGIQADALRGRGGPDLMSLFIDGQGTEL